METQAFARRVLLGRTLDDKLFSPTALTDARPRFVGTLPRLPGRAPELALASGRTAAAPLEVPDDSIARGELLHAFANHELLAIELLAAALLRFDDAPAAFRRGLVNTLREEQRHLALYLQRMSVLGVELGACPLSGFFWRAMSGLDTPEAFVAHLSLTFEQANLDFAVHYRRAFEQLGDVETAAVLQTVLDDEIGHVAFGLRWFERWRERDLSLFESHRATLLPPLQIVRAKAAGFEAEPRRRAGLPESYIDRLRTCGGSRGRPARVWWFNGAVEQEVEHGLSYTPSRSTAAAIRDLETVPMVFSTENDVVLVRDAPRPAFLDGLARAGFVLPRFEEAALERSPWPAPRRVGALAEMCPWGASPRTEAFSTTARARMASPDGALWTDGLRTLYDKRTTVRLAAALVEEPCWCPPSLLPRIAAGWADVLAVQAEFDRYGHRTRIKPVFGAAGRGHRVLRDEAEDRRFVEGQLGRAGAVVVEPEFEVEAQFSIRLEAQDAGARVTSLGRAASTARGQFDYAVLGPFDVGLAPDVRRWLRGDGRDPHRLKRMAEAVAGAVGGPMVDAGFKGPAGVDALLVHTADGLRLRPLVDLNPRRTMGHAAQVLADRVSRRAFGVWRVTTLADARALGHADLQAWAESTTPAGFESVDGIVRMCRGVLHTTDPARAESLVLSLSVARTIDAALSAVRVRRSRARQSPRSPRTRGPSA